MIFPMNESYEWRYQIRNRPPYVLDDLYAVCKACEMVLLETNAGMHAQYCTAPASEKEKVICLHGEWVTRLSALNLNTILDMN